MTSPWITASDDGWDESRTPWNVAVDQQPAGAVRATSAADVADAVRSARGKGLRVMVQNTGHAASHHHDLSDVLLVRTGAMQDVSVDVDAGVARVSAGTQWQAVADAAAPHGLAGLAGSSGGVGTVGYTLGGGLGWLGRAHGFACGQLLAAEVVLSDGTLLRTDDSNEPELIWALRGGGGSFAAVTSVDIGLVPVRQIYGGSLFFPADRASEVLSAWSSWLDMIPETVTSTGRVLNIPPLETVPEPLRGRSFAVVQAVFLMSEPDASELLAPLRGLDAAIDTFVVLPASELGTIHMDPPMPVPADLEGWLVEGFGAAEVAAVVANSGPGSPLLGVQVRHLGGALSRAGSRPAALSAINESFAVYGVGLVPEPTAATAVRAALGELGSSLRGGSTERAFMNFAEQADPTTLFPSDVYQRLSQARAKYDPDRVFVAAHDIG